MLLILRTDLGHAHTHPCTGSYLHSQTLTVKITIVSLLFSPLTGNHSTATFPFAILVPKVKKCFTTTICITRYTVFIFAWFWSLCECDPIQCKHPACFPLTVMLLIFIHAGNCSCIIFIIWKHPHLPTLSVDTGRFLFLLTEVML